MRNGGNGRSCELPEILMKCFDFIIYKKIFPKIAKVLMFRMKGFKKKTAVLGNSNKIFYENKEVL